MHMSRGNNSSASATQHAAASLCEEIVALWRLAALNPRLSPSQRQDLCTKFREWHISTVEKVRQPSLSLSLSRLTLPVIVIIITLSFDSSCHCCHHRHHSLI